MSNDFINDITAGMEAVGFIYGSCIALGIGAKFVPMKKHNKFPGIYFPSFL